MKLDKKEQTCTKDKNEPVSSPQTLTNPRPESVESYWTEERIRNAAPMPMPKISETQPKAEIRCNPSETREDAPSGNPKVKGTQVKVDKEQLYITKEVLANNEAKLMSIPGVVGVGMGLTEEEDRPAIHVYVDLESSSAIPSAVPKQINSVPVRVIETGEIKAQ